MAKDFEGAAAYLNDYTPWAEMSDGARKEWQKRARALLDGSTPFGRFTQDDLAPLCGLKAQSAISDRLAWSEADSKSDADKRAKRTAQRQAQVVRQMAKADPEFVAEALGKVDPTVLIEAAAQVQGRTRTTSPTSNVEGAFGPREFNRFEDAIEALIARLPDLGPDTDTKQYARDLAAKADFVAEALRTWAKGQDVGQEVEEWLNAR